MVELDQECVFSIRNTLMTSYHGSNGGIIRPNQSPVGDHSTESPYQKQSIRDTRVIVWRFLETFFFWHGLGAETGKRRDISYWLRDEPHIPT